MKPLVLTNHSLEQYASRTGRNQFSCAAELINSIRTSLKVDYHHVGEYGFTVLRRFKDDTYHVWYDPKIDEYLLAIIARDGAVKTVLRKEMYSYKNNGKIRYEKGGKFSYGYESIKGRKGRRRV